MTNTFPDTKQTRVVKKTIPTPSFFDFFNPATPPSDDDEEIDEDIEQKLELDYQLGEDIKEKPSTGSPARLFNSSTAWTTLTRTTSRMRTTLMMTRIVTMMTRRRMRMTR
jgi:hypothetical protein